MLDASFYKGSTVVIPLIQFKTVSKAGLTVVSVV